jgi:hypothetical protein
MGIFIGRREWTQDEDRKLVGLFDNGVTRRDLPAYFPDRTTPAVHSRLRYLRPPEHCGAEVLRRNAEELRLATINLLCRMDPKQVAELLGRDDAREPGTERAMRGQLAERRLAA